MKADVTGRGLLYHHVDRLDMAAWFSLDENALGGRLDQLPEGGA